MLKRLKILCKKFKDKIMVPSDLAVCMDDKRFGIFCRVKFQTCQYYDLGTETITEYARVIRNARTIFANGPAGVFEKEGFNQGTEDILKCNSIFSRIFYYWRRTS